MATWNDFISLLTEALGSDNVKKGTGKQANTATATFEQTLKLKDGTEKKRSQKLHFEYDGTNAGWIAVTSFVGPAEAADIPDFLAGLGEDWKLPAAVIVDEQLALRHHFGLPEINGGKDAEEVNKELLARALVSSVVVGSFADFLEAHYTEEDAR
ncbi:hypothetical protein [Kitasatospora sp. NPDC056273]|uniref:hypothetical protein n=1 Tax=Kitasatospora sp. NPDC056273 TaxID=3345769 RepID=UPI0035E18B98